MANYTIELGKLVQSGFNPFDFDYDFYDEAKKKDFEQLFIDRFYNYEIGVETPTRWRRYLSVTMRTKFPYYNMLLVTAQINYEKTKNYNITETQSREVHNNNNVTGSNSNNSVDSINGNSSTVSNSTDIGNKSNNLDSVTDHDDSNTIARNEKQTDNSTVTLDDEKIVDSTKVHSNTPKTMLSLTNIKSNVYASDADRQDNIETEKSTNKTVASKNNDVNELDRRTIKDIVNADNQEASRNENETNVQSSNTGSASKSETGNMTQNANGTTTEAYTRTMSGSYGVITEADMLQKHIALQEKLTTIYNDFFEECHDLFIQLWN